LQSFFELLVLRPLLYGGQASPSKLTIQEVKIKKKINANKIVFHLMKVKEKIANLEVDPTLMKPYSHI
jgi:demethoxyubiquinone hydroxylase (CLK1/Coq7/Cat5 family)